VQVFSWGGSWENLKPNIIIIWNGQMNLHVHCSVTLYIIFCLQYKVYISFISHMHDWTVYILYLKIWLHNNLYMFTSTSWTSLGERASHHKVGCTHPSFKCLVWQHTSEKIKTA
jgi:hypothetical protein